MFDIAGVVRLKRNAVALVIRSGKNKEVLSTGQYKINQYDLQCMRDTQEKTDTDIIYYTIKNKTICLTLQANA